MYSKVGTMSDHDKDSNPQQDVERLPPANLAWHEYDMGSTADPVKNPKPQQESERLPPDNKKKNKKKGKKKNKNNNKTDTVKDIDSTADPAKDSKPQQEGERLPSDNKKKNKKNNKKKNKKNNKTDPDKDSKPQQDGERLPSDNTKKNKKKNKRRRRGPGEDRYFGKFHCKICNKRWESAHVYTVAGTLKVKYKQRCKNCTGDGSWVNPFDLDMIRCSICQEPSKACKCLCEDCDKLWYRPRGRLGVKVTASGATEILSDDDFCSCDRRNSKKPGLGEKIDDKKPHRTDLCQRCMIGKPCRGSSKLEEEEDDDYPDNEP